MVGGGKEVVGELQGGVGKLGVESIRVEEGRRGVFHGEQKCSGGWRSPAHVGKLVWCTKGPIEGS
jgi:hypothetical protein